MVITKKFKVSEYITLKLNRFNLEEDYGYVSLGRSSGETLIYMAGELFIQCKYLLLNQFEVNDLQDFQDKVSNVIHDVSSSSIDGQAELLDKSLEGRERELKMDILPEEEFWAHASNLQAWVESGYDSRLLHCTLSFSLLKRLTELGDPQARKMFKDEIAERFAEGTDSTRNFLIKEGYYRYLDDDELWSILPPEGAIVRKIRDALKCEYFIEGFLTYKESRRPLGFALEEKNVIKMIFSDLTPSKDCWGWIFETLREMRNLEKILITNCNLEDLPDYIGKFREMIILNLDSNRVKILPESIGNLSSLESLNLRGNQLTTLPESIGNLSSLETLNLSVNQLRTVPESIGNLNSLEYLYLDGNQLTTLPESIGNLSSLETLNLRGNPLTMLPESIGNLKSLKSLWLSNNQLMTLPESIYNLKSLKSLNLRGNQLTTLPESIGNLSSLESLNLRGNQLTTLPESIYNLKSLKSLWLSNNQLTTLPEAIKSLKKRGVYISLS